MSAMDDFPDLVIPLEAANALNQYFEFCEERHRARIAAQKQAAEEALAELANEKESAVDQTAPSPEQQRTKHPGPLYPNMATAAKGDDEATCGRR